ALTVTQTIRNFKPLASALEAIYLVEASPSLRETQHKLLCGSNPLKETDMGHQSTSRHAGNLRVVWTEDIRFVPKDASKTPFIIAHEFFDALPIHIFQSVPPSTETNTITTPTGTHTTRLPRASQTNQWREMVVSPSPPYQIAAPKATPESQPEFQLTLAKASTPHSLYLPETSPRYQALKSTTGATIEISPESQAYASDFAVRIGGSNPISTSRPSSASQATASTRTVGSLRQDESIQKVTPSGAALILDYGPPSTIPANSLRGIRAHTRVSPFTAPGQVDVSADVDFLALAESAINASPGVEVHGPVSQAVFLEAMGIKERATQLVKQAVDRERGGSADGKTSGVKSRKEDLTEQVQRIESGWKRLVDRSPQGMGRLYQAMAIVPYRPVKEGEPRRRPVGFGGDIKL
ncbi:hypothetical protein LTR28_009361, partial [Elasticomyces elasticus]